MAPAPDGGRSQHTGAADHVCLSHLRAAALDTDIAQYRCPRRRDRGGLASHAQRHRGVSGTSQESGRPPRRSSCLGAPRTRSVHISAPTKLEAARLAVEHVQPGAAGHPGGVRKGALGGRTVGDVSARDPAFSREKSLLLTFIERKERSVHQADVLVARLCLSPPKTEMPHEVFNSPRAAERE